MKKRLSVEQSGAVHAIFAGIVGVVLYKIVNTPAIFKNAGTITGLFFDMFYIFIFYMYIPFEFSCLYLAVVGYIIDLIHCTVNLSLLSAVLLALAIFTVFYVVFFLQEGAILIVSGIFLIFRLLRRI